MAEANKILSQHEVDALLMAIDSGDVEVGVEEVPAKQVMPYDFKRPERVARDQLRSIETLHEVFARNLQASLSGRLRTMIDLKIASVDQLTFSEFINSLPNPTVFTVLSCEPLEGNFILELNPIIAFPIIERMLGSGRAGSVQPERALTDIEWKLVEGVIDLALQHLKDVWSTVAPANFKVTAREANPQLMQIFNANEAVVSVVIELTMGDHKGYMNICIPVMALEGVMEKIASHTWFASRKKEQAPGQEGIISKALAPAEVTVIAHLPIETIALKDLQKLKAGDVIATGHPETAPVLVSMEGRPKFVGRLGRVKDHKAFKVTGQLDASRELTVLQPKSAVTVHPASENASEADGKSTEAPPPPIHHLLQIPVPATVVLAEKSLKFSEVLALRPGDIIEFKKGLDDHLDLEAGARKIARGTAVKMGEKFGLQITQVREPREVVRSLGT